MAASILELKNIEKHFGMIIALSGVSIAVNEGEVHCLLGDNGAGKSTLIKTMSGVHKTEQRADLSRWAGGRVRQRARRDRRRNRHGLSRSRDDPNDVGDPKFLSGP